MFWSRRRLLRKPGAFAEVSGSAYAQLRAAKPDETRVRGGRSRQAQPLQHWCRGLPLRKDFACVLLPRARQPSLPAPADRSLPTPTAWPGSASGSLSIAPRLTCAMPAAAVESRQTQHSPSSQLPSANLSPRTTSARRILHRLHLQNPSGSSTLHRSPMRCCQSATGGPRPQDPECTARVSML